MKESYRGWEIVTSPVGEGRYTITIRKGRYELSNFGEWIGEKMALAVGKRQVDDEILRR